MKRSPISTAPNGTDGPEPILLRAPEAGRYRLEVKPLNEQAGSGSYTLAIQKLAGTPSKAPRHRAGAHQG
ncbi:MAG: hypothetical protein H6557_15800 [Lewinellaceae bacterium]|nr:hypothetical protein [Phaeodactylibacter sp.]MCB9038081.1 hypothetical protein [Lewinellaceae bacterium]